MTEESDGDEGEVVITHKLAWCSEGMNMCMYLCMHACKYVYVYTIFIAHLTA